MARPAIQLLKPCGWYSREIELSEELPHSLHSFPDPASGFLPEEVEHFLSEYTSTDSHILDLKGGFGTVALTCGLWGRVVHSVENDPLCSRMAQAKLAPADLTEVTLGLQQVDLRQPVDLTIYSKHFAPFYDLETYRELVNFKRYFRKASSRTARFVELLILSILHGPSAGYLSTYSSVSHSLSTKEQESLNLERGERPEYRALLPRILRKAAGVLRDSVPSVLFRASQRASFSVSEPQNLRSCSAPEFDLAFLSIQTQRRNQAMAKQWIRRWFCGLDPQTPSSKSSKGQQEDWNELLLESARVCRPGARLVISGLPRVPDPTELEAVQVVENTLSRFWRLDGMIQRKLVRGVRPALRNFVILERC